jgi:hypothetical protein
MGHKRAHEKNHSRKSQSTHSSSYNHEEGLATKRHKKHKNYSEKDESNLNKYSKPIIYVPFVPFCGSLCPESRQQWRAQRGQRGDERCDCA